jgi:oligosaccharide repeat unit polymerase
MVHVLTSPWIPLLALLAIGLFLRTLQGSSFSPSVFPALLWSIYLALPLALTPYPVAGSAGWVILALVAAAVVGALVGEGIGSDRPGDSRAVPPAFVRRLLRLCIVFSAVALIGVIYHGIASMNRFNLAWTSEGLAQLGAILYGMTYEENEPFLVRILVMWTFPAALLGGMCFGMSDRRSARILAFSSYLPSLLFALMVAARTGLMVATCCWAAGFLSIHAYRNRGQFRFSRKSTIGVILVAALLVGVFVGLDLVRGKEYGDTSGAIIRIQGSVLGYLAVFSNWITTDHNQELGFGAFTVAGAFDFLQIKTRLHGLYSEVLSFEAGEDSNIYSAFRGLIQDFTLPGALLVSAFWGFLAGFAYRRAAAGGLRWIVLVGAYYAFFFWSPIVSLFNYNGVILAFLVAFLVLSRLVPPSQVVPGRQLSIPTGGTLGSEFTS